MRSTRNRTVGTCRFIRVVKVIRVTAAGWFCFFERWGLPPLAALKSLMTLKTLRTLTTLYRSAADTAAINAAYRRTTLHRTVPYRCNSSFPPLSAALPRPPPTTKKRPATHSGAGRFVVSEPLSDYFIASRFTSFFAFAARAESLAIALFNWLLASLRLPSFAAMTARR